MSKATTPCPFCGTVLKDSVRAVSMHHRSNPTCNQRQIELDLAERDRAADAWDTGAGDAADLGVDAALPDVDGSSDGFPDVDEHESDTGTNHSNSNNSVREEADADGDAGDEDDEVDNDEEDDDDEGDDCSEKGSDSEGSEGSDRSDRSDGDADDEEDEDSSVGSDCSEKGSDSDGSDGSEGSDAVSFSELSAKLKAQQVLHSFQGQPPLDEPLPETIALQYRILDTLLRAGAPLSCFHDIVQLTRAAHAMQDPLPPTSRKKVLKDLSQRFHQTELKPTLVELKLPHGGTVKITTFDFVAALGSLLSDPTLMLDENLQFYETEDGSPLGSPPTLEPIVISDVLDGSACRYAYQIYVKTSDALLIPIILFIDKTHCDNNQRLTLEPLCMTLGIFKKEFRRLPQFWRTLGFVHNDRANSDSLTPQQKVEDYHYVLGHLLQSFKDAQRMDLQWQIEFKGKLYPVTLKIPLLFVIGDTEGHDKLCAHYLNRTYSKNICRYCYCPTNETGNPYANYPKTCASTISNLVDRGDVAAVNNLSYHCVLNALTGILFCDPTRGINGATPMELLHVVQHGLDQYKHKSLNTAKKEDNSGKRGKKRTAPQGLGEFRQVKAADKSDYYVFSPSLKRTINARAKQYGKLLVHQSDREYQRAYFKDGITAVACKQGHEERMVLVLYLIIFSGSLFTTFRDAFGSEERLSLYVLVMSHLLMIEDFMKKDTVQREEVLRLGKYMPHFMKMFKRATDRSEGMGMDIIKFHLLTHLAEDIIRFGPSTGYDSSFCESMHKAFKKDARRTQRRNNDSFQFQTATRGCERIAIACGMRSIHAQQQKTAVPRSLFRLSGKPSVFHQQLTSRADMSGGSGPVPQVLFTFLRGQEHLAGQVILRPTAEINGALYRADWKSGRYDWAYVHWSEWGNVVSRFKCFLEL